MTKTTSPGQSNDTTASASPPAGTFGRLVQTSERVGNTRARLTRRELLSALLAELSDAEFYIAVLYLRGVLRQRRTGVGYATLKRVLPVAAAGEMRLSLMQIDDNLQRLAAIRGSGAAGRREAALRELLQAASAEEQRFLLRLLCGEVRRNKLDGVVLEAVAEATQVPDTLLRRALTLRGDLAEVARIARSGGAEALTALTPSPFQPLQPMLADSAGSCAAVVQRHGDSMLEYKLDGKRVQVHKRGWQVKVYDRRLADVTPAVPEITTLCQSLAVNEVILDGEVLALRDDGRPHPVQTTLRRFRGTSNAALRARVPLSVLFFDCLYVEGENLTALPTLKRVAEMARVIAAQHLVPRLLTEDADRAQAFLDDALEAGHEGIVGKLATAPYLPGHRGHEWLKVKPVHTLDLVVLAAEWGHGRRSGWLSNLHLGARDGAGGFALLGKAFQGLSDKVLHWQTEALQQLAVRTEGNTVHVKPALVVEVAYNAIRTNPRYPAGMALRQARVNRYRVDKGPQDADTLEAVRALHAQGVQARAR